MSTFLPTNPIEASSLNHMARAGAEALKHNTSPLLPETGGNDVTEWASILSPSTLSPSASKANRLRIRKSIAGKPSPAVLRNWIRSNKAHQTQWSSTGCSRRQPRANNLKLKESNGEGTVSRRLWIPSSDQRSASEPQKTRTSLTTIYGRSEDPFKPDSDASPDISPASSPDTTPDTTPEATPEKPQQLFASSVFDGEVADLIRKPLSKRETNPSEPAKNYVFPVAGAENIVKVGRSKDTKARRCRIQQRCKNNLGDVLNPDQHPIKHFERAEKLILAQLSGCKHRFACLCGTAHREYFNLSKDAALEATRRWTTFCEREPWDEMGKLLPFWDQRLTYFQKCGREIDWDMFVNPSSWEKLQFNTASVMRRVWPQRWLWICLIQALHLSYLNYPSPTCLTISMVIIVWIMLELVFSKAELILGGGTPVTQRQRRRPAGG